MLVINHLGIRIARLIPSHQNSKPLLKSRYTPVTRISINKYQLCYGILSLNVLYWAVDAFVCILEYIRKHLFIDVKRV